MASITLTLDRAMGQSLLDALTVALTPPAKPRRYTDGMVVGIQSGNSLEQAYQPAGIANLLSRADCNVAVANGIDHFRIPANCSARANLAGVVPDLFLSQMKAQVDNTRGALIAAGKPGKVILDFNHGNGPRVGQYLYVSNWPAGIQAFTEAQHAARDTAIAVQVATYFKDYDLDLSLDLFNEPGQTNGIGITGDQLNAWYAQVVPAIRATDGNNDKRMLWLEPFGNDVAALQVPAGGNVGISPHNYFDFAYTHQGGALGPLTLTAFYAMQLQYKAIAAEKGVELWIGEAGSKKAQPDRAEYTAFVRAASAELGLPVCFWDFGSDFGLYDRVAKAWLPGIADALAGKGSWRDFPKPHAVDMSKARVRMVASGTKSAVSIGTEVASISNGIVSFAANNTGKDRMVSFVVPDTPAVQWGRVIPDQQTALKMEGFAFAPPTALGDDPTAKVKATGRSLDGGYKSADGSGFLYPEFATAANFAFNIVQPAGAPAISVRVRGYVA